MSIVSAFALIGILPTAASADDFVAMAEQIRVGARLLQEMVAPEQPHVTTHAAVVTVPAVGAGRRMRRVDVADRSYLVDAHGSWLRLVDADDLPLDSIARELAAVTSAPVATVILFGEPATAPARWRSASSSTSAPGCGTQSGWQAGFSTSLATTALMSWLSPRDRRRYPLAWLWIQRIRRMRSGHCMD